MPHNSSRIVGECLPSISKALGSIPIIVEEYGGNMKKKRKLVKGRKVERTALFL